MIQRITPMVAVCTAVLLLYAGATRASNSEPPTPATRPATTQPFDQQSLEANFQKMLTSAVLIGHFAVDGQHTPPKEDRYTIIRATKLRGEFWLLTARIEYGGRDVTVPLPVPVNWAGDTPVISVTDLTVPGIGTYTARVVFYRNRYAGTWSGTNHGGELWGTIEHPHE